MRILKNALHDLIRKNGIEEPIDRSRTLSVWQEIVGKKAGENTEATGIENGILTIKSSNAVWRQELQLIKTDLINKLNGETGKTTVKDIKFL
jgi:predicted nucleic acid-binding Zn ribbon protein